MSRNMGDRHKSNNLLNKSINPLEEEASDYESVDKGKSQKYLSQNKSMLSTKLSSTYGLGAHNNTIDYRNPLLTKIAK